MNSLMGLGMFIQNKLQFLNVLADKLNLKVRIPLARKTASNLMIPRLSASDNKVKSIFKLLWLAILVAILYSFLTIYVTPVMIQVYLTGKHVSQFVSFVLFILTLLIFEEEMRYLRKVTQAMDERVNINPFADSGSGVFDFKKSFTNLQSFLMTAFVGLAGAFIMNLGSTYDAKHVPNTSENIKNLTDLATAHPIFLVTITILLAPVIEEYFFRGIILRIPIVSFKQYDDIKDMHSIKVITTIIGLIASAALFAVAHQPNTLGYGLALFTTGVMLGSLLIFTGKIKYNIIAHMLCNLVPILVSLGAQIH